VISAFLILATKPSEKPTKISSSINSMQLTAEFLFKTLVLLNSGLFASGALRRSEDLKMLTTPSASPA
jgi:hypothetical protein